jgi:hypothetical protein
VCTSNMISPSGVVNLESVDYGGVRYLKRGGWMATDTECQALVKALLKAEMKRRSLTYDRLAEKLAQAGAPTTARILRTKVSRGGFSAAFFVQCLRAMGVDTLRLT